MFNSDQLLSARNLAEKAHAGQKRDGGEPYLVHPARVVMRLAKRFGLTDSALLAAAWCHDVLEDCPHVSHEELRQAIGEDAFALVQEVTNPSKNFSHLRRAERKAMDRAHVSKGSFRAKCLKLADRTDNMLDFDESTENQWLKVYLNETRALAAELAGTDAELEKDLADAMLVVSNRLQGN